MKKFLIAAFTLALWHTQASAQDKIVLNDSTTIQCKIDLITPIEISYRKWDNLNGPSRTIDKKKVSAIQFENGTREILSTPHIRHTMMFRQSIGLFNPVGRDVKTWGERGSSISASYQIGCFLDREKKISLTSSFYLIGAETHNIENKGVSLLFTGYGLNLKWDYHWRRWPKGSLYTGIGAGYFQTDYFYYTDDTFQRGSKITPSRELESGLGFQYTAIGLQYAPVRWFGLFAELGAGYEGLVQLGYQFSW